MCAPVPSNPLPFGRPPRRGVRLVFAPDISMAEIGATLDLSLFAARSLHGDDAVALDVSWSLDPASRAVTVDTSGRVGRSLALLFFGFVRREFGDAAVRVFRSGGGTGVAS